MHKNRYDIIADDYRIGFATMPRHERIYTVFVASPSDVIDERNKLEEIIRELNITWSRTLGIRLDLLRWETNALPGIADHPQSVINASIDDDYDIFIGLMWHRFGTATATYESGTVEEFERARARAQKVGNSVKLMLYFKDSAPLALSDIAPEQLAQVNSFRQSLSAQGILYSSYSKIDDFEKLLRIHLSTQIQNFIDNDVMTSIDSKQTETNHKILIETDGQTDTIENHRDEIGYIETIDLIDIHFTSAASVLAEISNYIDQLNVETKSATDNINKLSSAHNSDPKTARSAAKKEMRSISMHMDKFSERVTSQIPIFSSSLNDGMNCLVDFVQLSTDFNDHPEYNQQMDGSLENIEAMIVAMEQGRSGFENFLIAVSALPRLTADINRSKRNVGKTLDNLISEISSAQSVAREIADTIRIRRTDIS